jgi:hypothetical protein
MHFSGTGRIRVRFDQDQPIVSPDQLRHALQSGRLEIHFGDRHFPLRLPGHNDVQGYLDALCIHAGTIQVYQDED